MPKYTLPLSILVLTGLALYVALRPQPVLVDTAPVTQGPMQVTVADEGRWEVRELYTLSAPVSGHLQRVTVEAGDTVKAGAPLAWITPAEPALLDARTHAQAQAAVHTAEAERQYALAEREQAEAAHAQALAEARRMRETARRGRTSAAELETAELTLRSAAAAVAAAQAAVASREAQLASARALLAVNRAVADNGGSRLPLLAPVDGQVLRVLRESAQILPAGTAILELGNPQQMEVVTELLSRDAMRVRPGAQALLTDLGSGEQVSGTVRRVEPFGFTKLSALGVEEQRVRVHISPQALIPGAGHGYGADAAITVWETAEAVQVPLGALYRQDNTWSAFVARNGRAERRRLMLGQRNAAFAEVLEGLQPGEMLIMHPSERVTDGVRLEQQTLPSG